MGASENEKLELNIAATIKFSFGSICDKVQSQLENVDVLARKIYDSMFNQGDKSEENASEATRKIAEILAENAQNSIRILQREARNQGNNSIRIIENHMQHFKVLRRHKLDKTNVERIAKRHQKGSSDGDF